MADRMNPFEIGVLIGTRRRSERAREGRVQYFYSR